MANVQPSNQTQMFWIITRMLMHIKKAKEVIAPTQMFWVCVASFSLLKLLDSSGVGWGGS